MVIFILYMGIYSGIQVRRVGVKLNNKLFVDGIYLYGYVI